MTGAHPRIAVTLGDPRGIGPEIVSAVLARAELREQFTFVVVGPSGAGVDVDSDVGLWPPAGGATVEAAGQLSGRAIEVAVRLAQRGDVDGIVTAPIDKYALKAGGFDYPGHTEMLAHLTGCRTAMMLASDRLRVVLLTTHVPLREVPLLINAESIAHTAAITRRGLSVLFGLESPTIALCALNPHAGDGRRFGTEDEDILAPAAVQCGLVGPIAADTVFVRALRGEFDAVIAPYHDIGMTAVKVASFGSAVNLTLGLPFPRTSPDHGTALDIAGRGMADASSMLQAVRTCGAMVRRMRDGQ